MRDGEFRRADPLHAAISIVALIVFYSSDAPVLRMPGHTGACAQAGIQRRKQEALEFIRRGLFTDPSPLP